MSTEKKFKCKYLVNNLDELDHHGLDRPKSFMKFELTVYKSHNSETTEHYLMDINMTKGCDSPLASLECALFFMSALDSKCNDK